MKHKKANLMKHAAVAILSLLGYESFSQARSYSLDDCIKTALERNEEGALMPTVEINGQYQYYTQLPYQYAPASAFGGPDGEYSRMSLLMPQTTTASIQSTQNLFNQQVFAGIKAAEATREVTHQQVALTRENIVYNVTATYYSIQVLNDNLQRLVENIENLEKTVKINESLKANELISDNVHNRLLINLENLRNQYENQKLVQEKNFTTLKYLMNVGIDEAIEVVAFDYTETTPEFESLDISHRPDIQLQKAQIDLAKFDKKSIAAKYYPTLTGGMSFGYTGYYDDLSPFKQLNSDWINSSYVGLSLKIPVFDGFQKQNQIRQKDIAVRKSINTLTMLQSNAHKEVEDAIKNYDANKNLFESNKKSLDLAEQLFNTVQSEYTNGITSLSEFINAQNDLSNARTNYSTALLNLKLAELSLKKANGTLINQ
jgi:outer membrane protein TolC